MTRRRATEPIGTIVVKALGVLAACGLLAYLGLTVRDGVPGVSYYTVQAEFRDLGNVDRNADVRIAGHRVGQALRLRREDGRSVVDLQLENGAGPLPVDTTVRVRAVSLLGATYLDVRPGRSKRMLSKGATIPASQTSTAVALPEFLSAFDARTREGLRRAITELGKGSLGRGPQLNRMLRSTPGYLRDLGGLAQAIDERDGAARRFAPSLESVAAAVDTVREQIAGGFDPQARALRPFSVQRHALQRLLDQTPTALPAIRDGLERTDPLLAASEGFLRATTEMTRPAPASFREATALLDEARRPLRVTRPLLASAARAVPPLLDFTDRVDPEIAPLRDVLTDSIPVFDEMARRRCDFVGFAHNWRSFLRYGVEGGKDAIGPLNMLRFETVLNDESVGGGGSDVPNGPIGKEPYPPPCSAAGEGSGR